MTAPQNWTPLPALFPDAPRVRHLRDEFGPVGPYTLIVLLAQAATERYLGAERGTGKLAWKTLIDRTGSDALESRAWAAVERYGGTGREIDGLLTNPGEVVAEIERIGLIELIDSDDFGFAYRLVEWEEWDQAPKDPTAAERQRRHRAKKRSVTSVSGNAQDKTGQNRTSTTSSSEKTASPTVDRSEV